MNYCPLCDAEYTAGHTRSIVTLQLFTMAGDEAACPVESSAKLPHLHKRVASRLPERCKN